MEKLFRFFLAMPFCIVCRVAGAQSPAPFTSGNILVLRVGNGSATVASTANPVFLDEYPPTGTLVQVIALPVVGGIGDTLYRATFGSGNAEGLINLSANGQYVA